ncbi:MAG: hypothetical protein O7F12_03015 [Nitrospirae bacterium]|nr:hypothetical protein [Nitrospirota bacterium]
MSKRILIGCYEVPGYGGVSTASYQLYEHLQRDGLDVSYLTIIDGRDEEFYLFMFGENYANPKNLSNVSVCELNGKLLGRHPELTSSLDACRAEVMVGMGYIAALLMKRGMPKTPLIFLPSGCQQIKDQLAKHGDFLSLQSQLLNTKNRSALSHQEEKEAVKLSNLIIPHSDSMQFLFQHFFPNQVGKLYDEVIWRAEWIFQGASCYSFLAKPFSERDIDILFVASSWERPEKNFPFVRQLVPHLKDVRVHLIGECHDPLSQVTHHSLITNRDELFRIMGRTKTVVCPSVFDAAPGILYEASALGCNIIASKNCGNWKICHPSLLANPFTVETVVQNIRLSLEKKLPDNMDYFFQTKSYDNLVHILEVF